MSQILNIQGLSSQEILSEINRGGRFVVFEYCISILIMTFKRSSDVYFIRAGESASKYSLGFTLLTLLMGWWGIPWGPIYTIQAISTNAGGGKDITQEVLRLMK